MLRRAKLGGLAVAVAVLGGLCGYVAEAHAVDRAPFPGRPFGDAGPGYGAERQYYGAENIYSPLRGGYGRAGSYGRNYRSYGSFVDFGTGNLPTVYVPLGTFQQPSRAGVYPSYGSSSSSFVYLNVPGEGMVAPGVGGARIGVGASPADDQSNGKVTVSYVGGTKIIHIASEAKPPRAASANSAESRGRALEPWSEGWERYCTRTHPDFDPTRGTFTDANGRNRFCTGE